MNKSDFHMKKILTTGTAGLLYITMLSVTAIQAQDSPKPAGQKDGINLFIRFADPLDLHDPTIICELENTTDTPVPFRLQGSKEGYGFGLHLIGEDGKEIEKTAKWLDFFETGDSIHTRYGALRPGILFGPIEMKLEEAYGPNWVLGARLDIEWNSREPRREPGPFGGRFGIGSGVRGSLDLTPLTGKKLLPVIEPQTPDPVEDSENITSTPDDGSPPSPPFEDGTVLKKQDNHPPSAQVTERNAFYGISWLWIISAVMTLMAGSFLLGRKFSSHKQ
jgi:hypothetical protein